MNDELVKQYKLTYQNAKGEVKTHTVSQPFDKVLNNGQKVGFVAYSYGKGIRSFREDRILDMDEL